MFDIQIPLFESEDLRLGALDYEKDPEIEARWTHDPEFMRNMYLQPMRPLSQFQLKKKYEALEKKIQEEKKSYHFRIRSRADDRLIGFGEIYGIAPANATGFVRIGIGSGGDRGRGFGKQALALLMRYAFVELNLFRLTAFIPEYNTAGLAFFQKAGFVEEVCRREALERDGRRWDLLHYGLLADEWRARQK